MAKRTARWEHREENRVRSKARQGAWAALTPQQQLAALDKRLGVGVGATRQRIKLIEKIKHQ